MSQWLPGPCSWLGVGWTSTAKHLGNKIQFPINNGYCVNISASLISSVPALEVREKPLFSLLRAFFWKDLPVVWQSYHAMSLLCNVCTYVTPRAKAAPCWMHRWDEEGWQPMSHCHLTQVSGDFFPLGRPRLRASGGFSCPYHRSPDLLLSCFVLVAKEWLCLATSINIQPTYTSVPCWQQDLKLICITSFHHWIVISFLLYSSF